MAGILLLARFRSGGDYLSVWRRDHEYAGYEWNQGLPRVYRECRRALTRGLGSAKRAADFRAEELELHPFRPEPLVKRGPRCPNEMAATGVCWIMRGDELFGLLREQATLDHDRKEVTLTLAATKENTSAERCRRTLGCICGKGVAGPCPFLAVERALEDGDKRQLTPKHPLFPGPDGRAVSRRRAVATLRAVTGTDASEHSERRAGAQMYARRGLLVPLIQFLARWGGAGDRPLRRRRPEWTVGRSGLGRRARGADLHVQVHRERRARSAAEVRRAGARLGTLGTRTRTHRR